MDFSTARRIHRAAGQCNDVESPVGRLSFGQVPCPAFLKGGGQVHADHRQTRPRIASMERKKVADESIDGLVSHHSTQAQELGGGTFTILAITRHAPAASATTLTISLPLPFICCLTDQFPPPVDQPSLATHYKAKQAHRSRISTQAPQQALIFNIYYRPPTAYTIRLCSDKKRDALQEHLPFVPLYWQPRVPIAAMGRSIKIHTDWPKSHRQPAYGYLSSPPLPSASLYPLHSDIGRFRPIL